MSHSRTRTDVPLHGNYHGYYAKRPFVKDPRLALLPRSLFAGASVLDVGCNEGWVTSQSWGAHKVVGVDIDDLLVRAAWKRRRTLWSLQAPSKSGTEDAIDETNPRKKRKMHVEENILCTSEQTGADYFPASCEHMFGPLPIPPSQQRGRHIFPHNVSFHTADWVNQGVFEDKESYDVVVAFSISKWIHLNGGDAALMKFFERVYSVLRTGGAFVLEPQAWETYAKAKRMDETLRENAKDLKILPDGFESVLGDIGFSPAQHLGVTGEGGFHRPVDLYTKV